MGLCIVKCHSYTFVNLDSSNHGLQKESRVVSINLDDILTFNRYGFALRIEYFDPHRGTLQFRCRLFCFDASGDTVWNVLPGFLMGDSLVY